MHGCPLYKCLRTWLSVLTYTTYGNLKCTDICIYYIFSACKFQAATCGASVSELYTSQMDCFISNINATCLAYSLIPRLTLHAGQGLGTRLLGPKFIEFSYFTRREELSCCRNYCSYQVQA